MRTIIGTVGADSASAPAAHVAADCRVPPLPSPYLQAAEESAAPPQLLGDRDGGHALTRARALCREQLCAPMGLACAIWHVHEQGTGVPMCASPMFTWYLVQGAMHTCTPSSCSAGSVCMHIPQPGSRSPTADGHVHTPGGVQMCVPTCPAARSVYTRALGRCPRRQARAHVFCGQHWECMCACVLPPGVWARGGGRRCSESAPRSCWGAGLRGEGAARPPISCLSVLQRSPPARFLSEPRCYFRASAQGAEVRGHRGPGSQILSWPRARARVHVQTRVCNCRHKRPSVRRQ